MKQFTGTSIKTRLYLLVAIAFIPVAASIFYIAEEQKAAQLESVLHKTVLFARMAADEERQLLQSSRNVLTLVAEALIDFPKNTEGLPDLLARLLASTTGYVDIGVIAPDGRLLFDAGRVPTGRNYSNTLWFSEALGGRQIQIGPYRGEHIGDRPVLYVAMPAENRQGQIVAVVFAASDLNWMNRMRFLRLSGLPPGGRLTLLDEGKSIARYDTGAADWAAPGPISPHLRQELGRRLTGTVSGIDADGMKRIYAFASVDSPIRKRPVSILLDIPERTALRSSWQVLKRTGLLLAASLLIALLTVWWAGDYFILRRIRTLVRAGRELADGNLEARVGGSAGRDEIGHLAGVFDDMAATLQKRIEKEALATASLAESRERIRNLSAYQQDVREKERIRIAREIHDQFGQSLTILKMDLAWLRKRLTEDGCEVDQKLDAMSAAIDEALENLHSVTAELRPAILDDFGLAAAIEWQLEEFRTRSGIDCRIEQTGFEPELPMEQATALFRIFQEILTNVARHAQADRVTVRLDRFENDLILKVQDNGRGISGAEIEAPESYGLLGMRERLYPWNGRVAIEGRPGKGTCITVHLPVS